MIDVTISLSEIREFMFEELANHYVLTKMREAGIPAKGMLYFHGVERGTLEKTNDPETGDIKLTWRDED